jgi:hypothetical protein
MAWVSAKDAGSPRLRMREEICLRFKTASSLFCLILISHATVCAVEPGPELLLWANGAPGAEGKTGDEQVRIVNGERVEAEREIGSLGRCSEDQDYW